MRKILLFLFIYLSVSSLSAQTMLDTAANFTVKDVYGNTIKLYDILNEGKLVVIDFFSTACGSCQQYAPDMQMAYEEFGCNSSNVFFMGIDKGNDNAAVMEFDSIYGIHYPSVSGNEGGGNQVHLLYEIQATPTTVVIQPDGYIITPQIYPPTFNSIVDSVSNAGGIPQSCLTTITDIRKENKLTIRPNPARNYANIQLELESDKTLDIKIFNLTGKLIYQAENTYFQAGTHTLKADLSSEPEGFYFVQLLEKNTVVSTQKLILAK